MKRTHFAAAVALAVGLAAMGAEAGDQPPGAFVLSSVNVPGCDTLRTAVLDAAAPHFGQPVTLDDLNAIAAKAQNAYRESGFPLSVVLLPEQRVTGGAVTFQCVEGRISKVTVSQAGQAGDDLAPVSYVSDLLTPVMAERPATREGVERALALVSAVPGLSVKAVNLRPDDETVGGAVLDTKAAFRRFDGGVGVDNSGSSEIGPWAGSAVLGVNSVLVSGDRLELTGYSTSDFKEQVFGRVGYDLPLTNDGLRLRSSVSRTWASLGGRLAELDVLGQSWRTSVALEYPVYLAAGKELWVSGGVATGDTSSSALSERMGEPSRVRALTFGVRGSAADVLGGGGSVVGDLTFRAAGEAFGGNTRFTMLTGGATFVQPTAYPVTLAARSTFQFTNDALPGSERFALGNQTFGKGFLPAAATGDNGVAARLEARAVVPPFFGGYEAQPYVFGEAGRTWGKSTADAYVISAGVGARFKTADDVALGVEYAVPASTNLTGAAGHRITASLSHKF